MISLLNPVHQWRGLADSRRSLQMRAARAQPNRERSKRSSYFQPSFITPPGGVSGCKGVDDIRVNPLFRSADSAPNQCGARPNSGLQNRCCKPATQRPDDGDLDCGGRAQRRHRFPSVALLPKAAWRFASRRSPYRVAASPPTCRPASEFEATRRGQSVRDYVPAVAEKAWTFSRLQPEPTRRVARR